MTDDVPLNPVGAAMHAVFVQGGFSTPGIEAWRILGDAMRRLKREPLDAEWAKGVRDTLAWLDEHPDQPGVRDEQARFLARHPEDWRAQLERASAAATEDEA